MVRAGRKLKWAFAVPLLCSFVCVSAQDSASSLLDTSGQIEIHGRSSSYLIRHLPLNAFPQLPQAIRERLDRRGCLIPQTYEAHSPENVIHASFERRGSSDWAVLCSANGTVSLFVFFSSGNGDPSVLATAPETSRVQLHGASNVLGFNWAIDPASPEQIHAAQLGVSHPAAHLDHDALADSVVDGRTTYRFYSNNAWTILDINN
jgi:hypothetical protein